MTPEQEELKRVYTYLYKNIMYRHACSIRDDAKSFDERKQFVKIVNYIKGFRFIA